MSVGWSLCLRSDSEYIDHKVGEEIQKCMDPDPVLEGTGKRVPAHMPRDVFVTLRL